MKYRIRISFDLPGNRDEERAAEIIHKTFTVVQKLVRGVVDFSANYPNSSTRISITVSTANVPPQAEALKIRLPQLEKLEIVDVSLN